MTVGESARADRPVLYRLFAFAGAAALAAALLVCRLVEPSPDGFGTHRQFGLPRCNAAAVLGIPCPTCGCTTAFAWMSRGRVGAALRANVFGVFLYLGFCLWFVDLAVAVGTGRPRLTPWLLVHAGPMGKVLAVVMAVGWVVKLVVWFA